MPTASSNVRVRGQRGKHMLVLSSSQFDPERTFERVLPNSDLALVNTVSVISPLNRVLTPGLWAHNVAGPKSLARTRLGRRFFWRDGIGGASRPLPELEQERLDSRQRRSGAHGRNGRDPAVDQEVCPDDVRRIVRREVNCQLRDFQRIGHPLAWIVGSKDVLNRLTLLFAWEATEHRRVRRAWA